MKLERLLRDVAPLAAAGSLDSDVSGVVCDSRHVRQANVFVAIPGNSGDGWAFVDDAVQRGAAAIVSEHEPRSRRDVVQVQVRDAREALSRMSASFFDNPSGKLVACGVTGTNGKTTSVYMLQAVLSACGLPCGLIGTVEYRVGERTIPAARTTPDAVTLQSLLAQIVASGCKAVAMEVSSHALDQKRSDGIAFDAAVFTNLTQDHLDYHVTMERYFQAKQRLFEALGSQGKKNAAAVINVDDEWGRRLWEMPSLAGRRIGFGLAARCDVAAESLRLAAEGSAFTACTPWGRFPVRLPLLGRFNVYNSLGVIAACGATGLPVERVVRALEGMTSVPGRMQMFGSPGGVQVFVDYAHTDDALANALSTLRELKPRRLIVVFGCGGNRDRGKRPKMGRVAELMADHAILTSDNPRKEDPAAILNEIASGFTSRDRFTMVEDRAGAIAAAIDMAGPGDIVLVAGKGHEQFQETASTTVPFDDRQVVRRLIERASDRS
jgi:UDP-N-acetylmuramoyl-L-alanyl-D-glutamate--2,6-diaminopimelate ligase